eukprot:TRINITY_DN21774_c0_g1_i1.p1 TRINITY_DN21774_c0_g1~~TRINITY_DN21774_c0_g1_i1.p1  ORF type:complete len:701 (+),score=111.74 TRINITY_DN21774_c0_g1_i1:133-2235(+)
MAPAVLSLPRAHCDLGGAALAVTEEEAAWLVGGRYSVVHRVVLYGKPEADCAPVAELLAKDTALLLALSPQLRPEDAEYPQWAYLANDKGISGWAQVEGPPLLKRPLRRRRLHGSWQVGGRYRVLGSPVLRADIDLESDAIGEVHSGEEVLVCILGLVLRSKSPRLRGYVRTDSGSLGWITIAIPGRQVLLDPHNLYHEEAGGGALSRMLSFALRAPPRRRVMVCGAEEIWEVGGKYRSLSRVPLYLKPEHNDKAVGFVKKGVLVLVQHIYHTLSPTGDDEVWLQVRFESMKGEKAKMGWVRVTNSSGKRVIDIRDQLEYAKLLQAHGGDDASGAADAADGADAGSLTSSGDCGSEARDVPRFTAVIDHSSAEGSLGVQIEADEDDWGSLRICRIGPGPLERWNSDHPDMEISVGDRIIGVNGLMGDAEVLLAELRKRKVLRVAVANSRRKSMHSSRRQLPPTDARCTDSASADVTAARAAAGAQPVSLRAAFDAAALASRSCESPAVCSAAAGPRADTLRQQSELDDEDEAVSTGGTICVEPAPEPPQLSSRGSRQHDDGRRYPDDLWASEGMSRPCDDIHQEVGDALGDYTRRALGQGVTQPFLVEDGPETRPFGDAPLEPEVPEFECPCRRSKKGGLGCDDEAAANPAANFLRRLLESVAGDLGCGWSAGAAFRRGATASQNNGVAGMTPRSPALGR